MSESSRPLKVACLLDRFPCLSESFILRELQGLQAIDCEMTVMALRRPTAPVPHSRAAWSGTVLYADSFSLAARAAACGHFLVRAPARCLAVLVRLALDTVAHPLLNRHALRYLPCACVFARAAEQRGIAHLHAHFAYVPADVARVMAALLGCPYTVSAHAWDIHAQSAAALRLRLRRAAAITVCSRDGRDALLRKLPAALRARVNLIHHGLPADLLPPRTDRPLPADGLPLILAVGRLVEKKGLADLIEACRIMRDQAVVFRCRIVGDGPQRPRLLAAIRRHALQELVTLEGELDPDDVMRTYAEADLLAYPAVVCADGDRDGIPNVILEAMAMERPVVATRVGGIPEVVNDGVTGYLVAARAPAELAGRIVQLLAAPELRRRMGQAGRDVVTRDFKMETSARQLAQMYMQQAE